MTDAAAAAHGLVLVATYERRVHASLPRIWENVRDWEHLPWLHRGSFVDIRLIDESSAGWRARVSLPPATAPREAVIDVRLDQPNLRYLTRTLDGVGAGTEILTRLDPIDPRTTQITVEFRLPGIDPAHAGVVGAVYTRLYAQLWDEDETMMVRRQELLDGDAFAVRPDAPAAGGVPLGSLAALRDRLPLVTEVRGQSVRVIEIDGAIAVHATVCPHRGGPLGAAPVEDGCVTCPWHGYRFDLRSGREVAGRPYQLDCRRLRVDPNTSEVFVN